MNETDRNRINEWLYLEPDGELTPEQVAELEAHVEAAPELAIERRELAKMGELLSAARVEVRDGFKDELVAALPPAGWGARHPRTWWVAAAVVALLGGGSALLTGLSAARLEPASPFVGAMAAVFDMLFSSMRAGAGLIGASWKGIGLAVGDWIGASVPNAIAFGVVVVAVNLLLWRRLRRRERRALLAERDPSGVE